MKHDMNGKKKTYCTDPKMGQEQENGDDGLSYK